MNNLAERFWKKVQKSSPDKCWIWNGEKNTKGYGRINNSPGSPRRLMAHRVSYLIHFREIPNGLRVLHHCDNPSCVNVNHLFLGTIADNNADRKNKGRYSGEWNGRAKLDADKVRKLRRLKDEGWSYFKLAKEFKIHPDHARDVFNGMYWSHVK